jgi:glycosyltransferase involved in cell wall biosynthesis
MKKLTVVIPNRQGENPMLTIKSLYRSTFTDFDIIIINDTDGNANIARNTGFQQVHTPYVLFSDNDINWCPEALQSMYDMLQLRTDISYAWGSYELDGRIWCAKHWDEKELLRRNYISTMTMVRTVDHPGFDPKIRRLQDWDVWLTMLANGKRGEWIGKIAFTTPVRDGITRSSIGWEEALAVIKEKHKI